MKFGHRVQGTITDYDNKGRGTFELRRGEHTGYDRGEGTIAVPFSAQGDEIVGTFVKRDHGTKVVRLEQITSPSSNRREAPCPHAGICGGCLWQHLNYDAQIQLKHDMINRAFEGAGHEERITDVIPCEEELRYRNRMDYTVGWLGTVGLKEYGSWNKYLDLSTCLLLDDTTPALLEAARMLMRDGLLEPWDAKHHSGLLRYLVIRRGIHTQEQLIMLVVSDLKRITREARERILESFSPYATSLLLGEQPLITDISYVKSIETLKGNPWLEEEVNGIRYRIAPNSFFQTNTKMAAKLQEYVGAQLIAPELIGLEQAGRDESRPYRVLDLYCGLGFFGIHLAKHHPNIRISGFEIDTEAIELARHNAQANDVDTVCEFTSGPAEDLSWKDIPADTIILDPPRAGLHPRVLKTVLEKKPETIIYVSCNYHRLVEELKEFKKEYNIESMQALDLFPQTPHVEVVTKLVKSTS